MRRDNTPWRPVTAAAIGWTDEGVPQSLHFGDVYYSRDDGLAESEYVFLRGNDLPRRWLNWPAPGFCIAETGFGTGLNFLLTWQAWRDAPEPRPSLHYLSVEKFPLAPADMARALASWPSLKPLADSLLEQYPGLVPGQHRLVHDRGRLTLDLWWEDIEETLTDLASHGRPLVDAWYLDGFAPARNAQMWQPAVLRSVARLSRPGASFATFTAAGEVRRQLSGAGFAVEKTAGFGRKRECLRGRLGAPVPPVPAAPSIPAWDLPATQPAAPERAIVLGAGLAGCTMAAALARRGVEVFLLDQAALAGAGSGNEQGVIYTRLSRRHSTLTDFSVQSFRFSTAFYRNLFAEGALAQGIDGDLCGSFHQSANSQDMTALSAALHGVPEFARVIDAAEASAILGIDQPAAGYWFPRSGWLHPAALCRVLAAHPLIRLQAHCGAISLHPIATGWRATAADGRAWDAPCAVIAAGTACGGLLGLDWLPLQSIRGQTTTLPSDDPYRRLRAVLCHEGYIAPARNGAHCIGATFNLNDTDPAARPRDHLANQAGLARAVPAWREQLERLDPGALDGRVGFRCTSPDYLPLAGPVPDRQAFLNDFAGLRRNAKLAISQPGQYLQGLYLSTAHGSRGLTSTPLAAELLASQICGEPPPISRELCRALAPARFIIRDLSRNRI